MIPLPHIAGVTHRYVSVKNVRLHIAEAGKGEPLLFIHGWPQHWYVWRKLIPLLADKYKLIMVDLPGFGWSESPKNFDYNKEALAACLIGLLDVLKLHRVGLIGHDWGGWIGFLACLHNPERFTQFLALGITSPVKNSRSSILDYRRFLYQLPIAMPFFGEWLLQNVPSVLKNGVNRCTYTNNAWTTEELEIFSDMVRDPKRAQASSRLYRTFLTKELLPIFLGKYKNQKLQVPTRLLIGKNDPVIHPSLFKNFTTKDPVTIDIVENCGHFIPEEKPERVASEIFHFFAGLK